MGLFGSRKSDTTTHQETSTHSQSQPEKREPDFESINEEAAVIEREVAIPKPDGLERYTASTLPEQPSGSATKEPDAADKPAYIPFRDKPSVSHVIGSTIILAVINQKGGVGKSTTAVNLAASLGAAGKEVLLVDLDPQGNATSGFGIEKSDVKECVYDVLLEEASIEDVILAQVGKGVDLLPSSINLAGAEVELVNEMARENRLKNALGGLRGLYDFVLIDCPPSLGLLTINALVAADKLLVPIQCEFYALEGLTKLLDSMSRVKKMLNPGLGIYGIVLTMYDSRTNLSKQVVGEVREYFGQQVFDTVIPRTVKLSEAPSYGLPINQYAPESKGAKAYDSLAQEVIARG